MTSGLYVVLCVVFVAFAVPAFLILAALRRRRGPAWARQIERFRPPDPGGSPADGRDGQGRGGESAGSDQAGVPGALLTISRRAVGSGGLEERMALDLDRAGMRMRPHEWALLRTGLTVGLALVVGLATRNAVFGLLIGGVVGWAGGRVYIKGRIDRRRTRFADQLPDSLQVMASSLRSGFSVAQSLERLADQDTQPIAGELSRALAETRLGASLEDSLDKVATRMECHDLHWVVMAIRIQREVGGNLPEVIDSTIETMRERTRLRGHIRALSAEGRLSAYVLIALPIVLAGLMLLIRPEYVRPLYTTPPGLVMLVFGSVLVTAGWLWMSQMIKVRV